MTLNWRSGPLLAALGAAAAVALILLGRFLHEESRQRLYIYNWADFIGPDTVADFERATGIEVVYDTYDSEETMETKLMAGGSGYDLVVASSEYYGREIRAGVYQPLDRKLLPLWPNLDPHALEVSAAFDPGNRHALPYLHSINGFAYDADLISARMPDAPVDSLDMIFKPEIIRRFADCGVTFIDSPEDMLLLALRYLGRDPNSVSAEDYAAAEALLARVRPYVRAFDSTEYLNGLANGELCLAVSWSSDYAIAMARARAAGVQRHLRFTVPREGANRNHAAFLIPVGAPHREAAHAFLNYLLQPRVIAAVTNEIYYGNDNRAANAWVKPEILADRTLYPDATIESRLYTAAEAGPAVERLRTRTWMRIKTGH